jgi:predicted XRE-type DNA-binding protein
LATTRDDIREQRRAVRNEFGQQLFRVQMGLMPNNAFYDLADSPQEAANLTARGMLMIAIEQRIREEGWTQAEAAARLRLTQPRVSDLLNGKINKFSLDALVNMLPPVGLTIDVRHIERPPPRSAQKGRSVAADRSPGATARKRKSPSAH